MTYEIKNLNWQKHNGNLMAAEGMSHDYTIQFDQNKVKLFCVRKGERQEVFDFQHVQDAMDDAERHHRYHAKRFLKQIKKIRNRKPFALSLSKGRFPLRFATSCEAVLLRFDKLTTNGNFVLILF
nr:hypothetical protein [uncultured Moraxella sp.]